MKRVWHPEALVEHWTILPGEWPLIEHKHGATRLGFAVLFKFFQYAGAFPRAPQDVPLTVVDYVAQQVGVPADTWTQYAWDGRTIEYHRAQIRQHLGFREATVADGETLNQTTQHWHTGSSHHQAVEPSSDYPVYESHVD